MGKNLNPSARFLLGAANANTYRGRPEEAKDAGYAKKCECESPWLEPDPDDGSPHCIGCGRDYRP